MSKFPYVGVCEVVWMHFVSFGEKETYNFWMGVRQKNDGVCDVGDFIQNLFWVLAVVKAVEEDGKVCVGDGEMFACGLDEVGFVEIDGVDAKDVGGEVVDAIVATTNLTALSFNLFQIQNLFPIFQGVHVPYLRLFCADVVEFMLLCCEPYVMFFEDHDAPFVEWCRVGFDEVEAVKFEELFEVGKVE